MILPRFTIRAILVAMTICAVLFVMVGTATRGQNGAWGVAIGAVGLVATLLVHTACFVMVWVFGRMTSPEPPAARGEPLPRPQERAN